MLRQGGCSSASRIAVSAVITLLLLIESPALAVGPFSSETVDAPPEPWAAEPVPEGTHSGTLTRPFDSSDCYGTQVDAGRHLTLGIASDVLVRFELEVFAPDGFIYERFYTPQYPMTVLTSVTGTWVSCIRVVEPAPSTPPRIIRYTYTIASAPAVDPVVLRDDARWGSLEVAWDEETHVDAYLRFQFEERPQSLQSRIMAVEQCASGVDASPCVQWTVTAPAASTGGELQVTRPGQDPVHVPADAGLATPMPRRAGAQWIHISETFPAGSLRISAVDSGGAQVTMTVSCDGRCTAGTATGDDVVHWTSANGHADERLVTPVFATHSGSRFTVNLTENFLGSFSNFHTQGRAVSPSGDVHPAWPRLVFMNSEPGTWNFHMEPESGRTTSTTRTYLLGFERPDLGVFERGEG